MDPTATVTVTGRRPIAEIVGVQPTYAVALENLGIRYSTDLLDSDAARVASALGVPEDTVRNWQSMSDLLRIKGVGPQFADLLLECGIRSLRDLAAADPRDLVLRMLMTSTSRSLRFPMPPIGLGHTEKWVRQAQEFVGAPR